MLPAPHRCWTRCAPVFVSISPEPLGAQQGNRQRACPGRGHWTRAVPRRCHPGVRDELVLMQRRRHGGGGRDITPASARRRDWPCDMLRAGAARRIDRARRRSRAAHPAELAGADLDDSVRRRRRLRGDAAHAEVRGCGKAPTCAAAHDVLLSRACARRYRTRPGHGGAGLRGCRRTLAAGGCSMIGSRRRRAGRGYGRGMYHVIISGRAGATCGAAQPKERGRCLERAMCYERATRRSR